jgi:hypothetical protein
LGGRSGRLLSPPSIPSLEIERYGIPKFDIADNQNKQEPDPNQGTLFNNEENPEQNKPSDETDTKGTEKDEENKKDNPDTGLFFDKEEDE